MAGQIDEPTARANGNILRIPASVDDLATVRQFIRQQARLAGADPGAVPDIVQAVDESVANAILHGYRGRDGTVEVEVDSSGRSLVVRLRDDAPPFDPTLLPAPDITLPLAARPLGGMGVYLARELMDKVTYQVTKDGNELTLVKECISRPGGGTC
jgi:serine/threonine-protein kinase RsbW